jgi:tetratricopeptide (TPR) repeat protein
MDAYERAANESAVFALMRAGNLRGAEARLRTMLGHNANDARALALLADCHLHRKEWKEGLKIARAAANVEPDDPLVRQVLSYALQAGGQGKKAKQEALGLAEDIAADDPEDSDALYSLAVARFNTGDHLGARMLFEDAERFAGSAHELINVAHLRLHEWNYAAAAELAQRAMLLDPNRHEVFEILGECALARKQPLESYELALEALRLSPGNRSVMRLLTRARARARPWLKPFLPCIDWIVEMDRRGLVLVPVLIAVICFVFAVSLSYDLQKIEAGRDPAIILSVASGGLLLYALVCYLTAAAARFRIRRDLRRISLPDF